MMALRSAMASKIPMVIILGATGTGKTKLSVELAQRFQTEIISADSMQDNTNKKRKSDHDKENESGQNDLNKGRNKKPKVSHVMKNTRIMDAEETCPYEVEAFNDVECTKLTGRRIVDIQSFFDKLKAIANHSSLFSCGLHSTEIVSECKKGLYSRLNIQCILCNKKFQVETTDPDVNKNAVSGVMASGGGHAQLQQLTAAVNLPDIGANVYAKIQDAISDEWETTAWTEMLKAGQAEREAAIKEHRVSKDGIALIDVIVDGCWSKRSYQTNYAASSGCAAIIGRRTGKVLYMAVKNKYCCICQKNGSTPQEHPCYKNFEGPSTAMESTIIAEGFKRSIEMHNIIYQRFIADGDSSTYAKIIDSRPYPNVTVEKLNCRNHILRRFCNNMQKLITDTRYPLKDRKLITKGKILSARKYICDAIKLESEEKNYENLHANISNSVLHAFGNHCKCQKNICSLTEQRVTEFNTSSLWQRVKMLASNVASHSRSLIENVDSNVVEQFNGVIAKLVGGKRINYTQRRGYQTRCSGAVISFNTGKLLSTVLRNIHQKSPSTRMKKFDEKVCLKRERNRQMSRKKKRHFNTQKSIDLNYGENAEQPDKDPVTFNMDKEAFLKNLEKSEEERNRIQKQTIMQSECGQWLELRRNLLTASNFGKVIKRRKNHSCRNMVKNMLYSKSLDNVSSIQHGRQHEAVALEQLRELKGIAINKCGLFIDEKHSFLGATPDGIAGDMVVEIKCPITPYKMGDIEAAIDKKKMHFWKKCKNGEVYKGLDVVTAKATAAERALVPHHLLDILEPHQNFTVVDFRNRALKIIQELTDQGKIPIVVGGTNYYMESIVYNILVEDVSDSEELLWNRSTRKRDYDDAGTSTDEPHTKKPVTAENYQINDKESPVSEYNKIEECKTKREPTVTTEIDAAKIKNDVDNEKLLTNEDIHLRLMLVDPVMADRLHPNNRRKMLRSIEVWLKTGRRHSDILAEQKQREGRLRRPGSTIVLWLKCEQAAHDERLNKRVDSMLQEGLIQELLDFHDRHNRQRLKDGKVPDYTRGVFQTLGFKEFHDYLMLSEDQRKEEQGQKLLLQSIENMKIGTRRYARRQNKMVKGRFLEHPNREVPPIYELDTTDVSKWDTQVKAKAINIIESYLNETPCQYETLTSETKEAKKGLNPFSNNYCEVCKRILIGDKEYAIHLKSNKHMKVLKKKNFEEKKKLQMQQSDEVNV